MHLEPDIDKVQVLGAARPNDIADGLNREAWKSTESSEIRWAGTSNAVSSAAQAMIGNLHIEIPQKDSANHATFSDAENDRSAKHINELAIAQLGRDYFNSIKIDPDQQYKDIVAAVDSKTPIFGADPNSSVLDSILPKLSVDERAHVQERYRADHATSMIETLRNGWKHQDETFQHFKGILMEKDGPASKAAVDLHDELTDVRSAYKTIQISALFAPVTPYSRIGPVGAASMMAHSNAVNDRDRKNEAIIHTAASVTPADATEIRAEYQRIYNTSIEEFATSARSEGSLSHDAAMALHRVGIL